MNNEIFCCESQRLGEKYYKTVHRSGLKIVVFPKNFSVCHAVLGTKFGSADHSYLSGERRIELPDGTAHFLEHKLFENEGGSNADEIFTALGAEANAYTTYTATRYMFSATDKIKECLETLLSFVTHPYFSKESVEKERGIITQEILMYDDDPYESAMENCLRKMYRNSGVRRSICGSVDSLSEINSDILYDTHKDFYNLNNMMLSVCGDVTIQQVLDVADRTLPSSPDNFTVERIGFEESKDVCEPYVEKRMNVSSPVFFIGVKDTFPNACDGYARIKRNLSMSILNNMLFAGTGELYSYMLKERLINPSFSFGYSVGDVCAMNSFSGISDYPERVFDLLKKKATAAAEGDLSQNDFERCRRSSLSAFLKSFDSSAEIADDVMMSLISSGVDPFHVPNIIESIGFDDIIYSAKDLFGHKNNWTFSLVLPF